MRGRDDTETFEQIRPKLLGLAYRILGSMADAEDAVQDTWLRWANADRGKVENSGAWLTTACTRRCIDMLRSASRARVSYVGAWLPEPIHTPAEDDAEARLDLASSLTTAFLLMLERLTPKERAAYLLREIFDVPYREIAETLDVRESACRKLVSRAKSNIDCSAVRHTTPLERQNKLVAAFQGALKDGATHELAELLSNDIRLSADGGGKVAAILDILHGKAKVLPFVANSLRQYWAGFDVSIVNINGALGMILKDQGVAVAAVSFAYDSSGAATDIYIVRNPDKLGSLDVAAIH